MSNTRDQKEGLSTQSIVSTLAKHCPTLRTVRRNLSQVCFAGAVGASWAAIRASNALTDTTNEVVGNAFSGFQSLVDGEHPIIAYAKTSHTLRTFPSQLNALEQAQTLQAALVCTAVGLFVAAKVIRPPAESKEDQQPSPQPN